MDKLQELYVKRKVFEDYGAPIPAELAEEIRKKENEIFWAYSSMVEEYMPDELDFEYDGRLTIMIDYEVGRLEGVGFVKDFNTEVVAQYYKNINQKCDPVAVPLEIGIPKDPEPNRTRSESIPFSVKFEDGKTIFGRNAQLTFIETLRHFGLEKVAKFNGESFKGYPLVGKKEYVAPDGHPRQKLVDGWWIYVNMPNWRKIRCINGIAKMLDVNVAVENIGSSRLPLELNPPVNKPKVEKRNKKSANPTLTYTLKTLTTGIDD